MQIQIQSAPLNSTAKVCSEEMVELSRLVELPVVALTNADRNDTM